MTALRVRADVEQLRIDDELFVLVPGAAKMTLLGGSACLVLELCDGTRSAADVVHAAAEAYGADAAVVRDDVLRVFARLTEVGILEPAG